MQIFVISSTGIINFSLIDEIQSSFPLRGLAANKRITAFSFEPSWIADQIVIPYFPLLIATLLTGIRLTQHRWFEPLLLLCSAILLMFTFSRGGIFLTLFVIVLVILMSSRIWLAVALRNFTQDSFTFPIMWVGFGMILGMASSIRR